MHYTSITLLEVLKYCESITIEQHLIEIHHEHHP
jgi:hypothetical protein